MPETIELKPCPFCGGEAFFQSSGNGKYNWLVKCQQCCAQTYNGETKSVAARYWNFRKEVEGTDEH